MKYHKNGNFFQFPNAIFEHYDLSSGAFRLYATLCFLEHRFTSGKSENETFLRTDEQLAKDAKCSFNSIRKYKQELLKNDLIEVGIGHFTKQSGEKSHGICSYRIKDI